MSRQADWPRIDLHRRWPQHVRSALLHVIALAQYAVTHTRSWAVNGRIARVRLKAQNDELKQQVALLTEEIRIKDAPHEAGRSTETAPLHTDRTHGHSGAPLPLEAGPRSRPPIPSSSRPPRLPPG